MCVFREQLHIPSRSALDILDNKFEGIKVKGCNSIECHIKQDQGPLKECIDGVGLNRQLRLAEGRE